MRNILEIIEKIKELEGIRFDKEVADVLEIEKSSLSHFKKRDVIPYDLIVQYCLNKNHSLDEILGLKNDELLSKFFSSKDLVNVDILDFKQSLVIPAGKIHQRFSKNAKAVLYDDNLFVMDMFKNKFDESGLYLIEFNDIIKIVEIKENQFTQEITIKDKQDENIVKREFIDTKLKILGKVLLRVDYIEPNN